MTTASHLATRCNACSTAFRVVQDQLKVSEGWVRCGRCDTVFNAFEQLFDLDDQPSAPGAPGDDGRQAHESLPELPSDDAPKPPLADAFSALLRSRGGPPAAVGSGRPASPGSPTPAGGAGATAAFTAWPAVPASPPAAAADRGGSGFDAHADADARAAHRQAQVDLLLDVPGDHPRDHPPAHPPAAADDDEAGAFAARRTAHDDAAPSSDAAAGGASTAAGVDFGDTLAGSDADAAAAAAAHAGPATAAAQAGTAAPTPDFVRAAERDARWRRPPVRRALAAASAALLLALALQAAHHFRDSLAAHWPPVRPWLAGWCEQWGCSVGPLRRIGDLTVENTALAPVGGAPGTFQLALTLRNRGPLAVALPAVDLSLTDSNGQLVARRALSPADFRPAERAAAGPSATDELLGPDTDTRLQTVLATEGRVVGYTVELFYP